MKNTLRRTLSVLLCLVLLCGTAAVGGEGLANRFGSLTPKASAADDEVKFVPRKTAPAAGTDVYYPYTSGTFYWEDGGNCTWYAWCRLNEIYGHVLTSRKSDEPIFKGGDGDGYKWFDKFKSCGYRSGSTPALGAIACWGKNSISELGHVAIVEAINEDGVPTLSWSEYSKYAYNRRLFVCEESYPQNIWIDDKTGLSYCGDFQGYIYTDYVRPKVSAKIKNASDEGFSVNIYCRDNFERIKELCVWVADYGASQEQFASSKQILPLRTVSMSIPFGDGSIYIAQAGTLRINYADFGGFRGPFTIYAVCWDASGNFTIDITDVFSAPIDKSVSGQYTTTKQTDLHRYPFEERNGKSTTIGSIPVGTILPAMGSYTNQWGATYYYVHIDDGRYGWVYSGHIQETNILLDWHLFLLHFAEMLADAAAAAQTDDLVMVGDQVVARSTLSTSELDLTLREYKPGVDPYELPELADSYVGTDDPPEEPQADASGDCGANGDNVKWYWYEESGLLEIKGTGAISDYPDNAPWSHHEIESVIIYGGVTKIGAKAFMHCTALRNVTIGNDVKEIGEKAFESCDALESIMIPASVTRIGRYAFAACIALESADIYATEIGDGAFDYCIALNNLNLREGIKQIGIISFANCTSLVSVTIPDSVTNLGQAAFRQCGALSSVIIGNGVPIIEDDTFGQCESLKHIELGDGVTSVASGSFWGCPLEYVKMGGGMTEIPSALIPRYYHHENTDDSTAPYYYNSAILYDTLGLSDDDLDSYLDYYIKWFHYTSPLKTFIIGNGVQSIPSDTFSACIHLTSITIPNSVTSIGEEAFAYCTGLTNVTIPDSVTSIGENAFSYCTGLKNITIPDSVTTISDFAFLFCTRLTHVSIPSSATTIEQGAFAYCTGLTSITIPSSVVNIENSAFAYCTKLTDVSIPNSVKEIANTAFTLVANVVYSTNMTASGSPWGARTANGYVDGSLIFKDRTRKQLTACLTSATGHIWVPDSVELINDYAFIHCRDIAEITIPDSVVVIRDSPFASCTALRSVHFGKNLRMIGWKDYSNPFLACFALEQITVSADNPYIHAKGNCLIASETKSLIAGCKASVIPADGSVTSIGTGAFQYCQELQSISIPNSVTTIKNMAFACCEKLEDIRFSGDVTTIDTTIEKMAFAFCVSLEHIIIPNGVTIIGEGAFGSCTSLKSVSISDSVTTIGEGAFGGCISLSSVSIPDSLTSIGQSAFGNCSQLSDVYYLGTESDRQKITIGENNKDLLNAAWHYQSYDPESHTHSFRMHWQSDSVSHWNVCICGAKSEAKAHAFDVVVTIPATTETEGEAIYTCSVCGYEKIDTIPRLTPHDLPETDLIQGNSTDNSKEYAYRSTVEFTANVPDGGSVQWYVDGEPAGNGAELTVEDRKESYTVTVVVTAPDGTQTMDEEHVTIQNNFWAKVVWFFRHLFFPAKYRIKQ